MNTYICSNITYTNHGSCCFNNFCYLNHRIDSSAHGFYSIHGITLYPRVFYGLRQSTLVNCSRRILGVNGFCRLVYSRDLSYEFFCKERRERRLACSIWEKEREREEGDSGLDVGVEEILSLLDGGSVREAERKVGRIGRKDQNVGCGRNREESSRFRREGSLKSNIGKSGFGGTEKESSIVGKLDGRRSRIMDGAVDLSMEYRRNSRKKEVIGGSDSSASYTKGEAMVKSREKYSSKMRNSSRFDAYRERKESSDTNRYVPSSGDYESKEVILTSDQGFLKKSDTRMAHMQKEEGKKSCTMSSSDYVSYERSDLGPERIGFFGERQFQKLDDNRRYGESSTRARAALEKIGVELMKQNARLKRGEMECNSNVSLSTQDNDVEWVTGKQSETHTGTTVKDKEATSTSAVVDLDWESRERYDQTEEQVSGEHESMRQDKVDSEVGVMGKSERFSALHNEQLGRTEQRASGKREPCSQNKVESEVRVVDNSERYSSQHNEQLDQTEQWISGKRQPRRQNMEMEIGLVDESERYSAQQSYFSWTDQLEESGYGQMDGRSAGNRTSEGVLMSPSPQSIGRGSIRTVSNAHPIASVAQEAFAESISSGFGVTFTNVREGAQENYFSRTDQLEESGYRQMDVRSTGNRTSEGVPMPPSPQSVGGGSMGAVSNAHPVASAVQEAFVEPISSGFGVTSTNILGGVHQNYFSRTDQFEESGHGQMDRRSIGNRTSEGVRMPASPQSIGGCSIGTVGNAYPVALGTVRDSHPVACIAQEAFVEPVSSGSGVTFTDIQGEMPQTSHISDTKTRRDENSRKSSELTAGNNALDSAICLEETSEKFVREFVDKVQQEILISHESQRTSTQTFQSEMEKSSGTTSASHQSSVEASTVYRHDGSDKKISDNSLMKEDGSRRSSGGFVTKGPSDEIWDVPEPSSSDPSQLEAPEKDILQMTPIGGSTEGTSTTGNSIVRRSSRSLWGYIAELVRKGLGVHVETNNSMPKAGTKTSSTESNSSEAWFSGHEPDDDENMKEKNGMGKEPFAVKNQIDLSHQRQQATSFDDRKSLVEAASTSKDGFEQGPLSKGASSSVSRKEAFGRIGSEKGKVGTLLNVVVEDSSSTSGNSEQEISESSKLKMPLERIASSALTMEVSEGSGTARLTKGVQIEGKEGELKQRRLKRNIQVQKERFEEWEEAFNHETEQRKIDEIFMREAMLEAKKAADTWEVPVGAVLVQDGKVIARGFNLVEGQRDSTAHAEMICIREASNVLRTWRLSGTTLYVTLEPCPMCAGAILQARINTVVWGSPNNLLGADGSWISLFPIGEEGRTGSDQSRQMVAPVHPFHPNITIRRGILASECSDLMQQFFQLRRRKKKPEPPPPSMPISHPSKFLTKIHNIFSTVFCL